MSANQSLHVMGITADCTNCWVHLALLDTKYIRDLKRHSEMLVREHKNIGRTETGSFKVSKSKPIIDEIDTTLAPYYGFIAEELDFIINYDLKYRAG